MASRYEKFITITGFPQHTVFQCIFCGQTWSPNLASGGRYTRGAYKCPNSCTEDYDEAYKRWEKILFMRNPSTGKFEPAMSAISTATVSQLPSNFSGWAGRRDKIGKIDLGKFEETKKK